MSTPRYLSAEPSLSGSAISVSKAITPSSPGRKSFTEGTLAHPHGPPVAECLHMDGREPRHRPYNRWLVMHVVTLIPGDGTGPELTEATRRVLEATGVDFEWDVQPAGADVMHEHGGDPLPESTLESIRRNGVALKGPITTPIGEGFRSVNVALRNKLDLYAQVRPCKTYPGVRTLYDDIDLVVVRENTEDLYTGIEFEAGAEDTAALVEWLAEHGMKLPHTDAGLSVKPISITGTRRVFEFAFD